MLCARQYPTRGALRETRFGGIVLAGCAIFGHAVANLARRGQIAHRGEISPFGNPLGKAALKAAENSHRDDALRTIR
jgi:hypothetical protein